jgi:hypothetical protein
LYADALIQSLGSNIDRQVLEDLSSIFPQNPRNLKLALRYIASLRGVLNRFDASEIDWRSLYICLMLRFEFPDETRALSKDKDTLRDIDLDYLRSSQKQTSPSQTDLSNKVKELPESSYAPKNEEDKARFLSLCKPLRQQDPLLKIRYKLNQLMNLSEQPPILTFKEIEEEVKLISDKTESTALSLLRDSLVDRGRLNFKKAQAFIDGLVDLRETFMGAVVDSEIEEEIKKGLEPVSKITEILRLTSIELGGFKEGALTHENWNNIFSHIKRWAHFETFEYYEKIREEERQLLKDIVATMPLDSCLKILESREFQRDDPFDQRAELFRTAAKEICEQLQIKASDYLLSCFERPRGIETFWGIDFYSKGKNLLFTRDSSFHSSTANRERLRELSNRAHQDSEIQRNFLTYFRMLCYGAFEARGSFDMEKCGDMLKDTDLLKFVWKAAVSRPLNPRVAGDLYRHRKKLIEKGVSSDVVATPQWWDKLAETGFFSPSRER